MAQGITAERAAPMRGPLEALDPVTYGFALCHTRMRGDCLGRRAPVCASCGLRPECRHWRGSAGTTR